MFVDPRNISDTCDEVLHHLILVFRLVQGDDTSDFDINMFSINQNRRSIVLSQVDQLTGVFIYIDPIPLYIRASVITSLLIQPFS